MLYLKLIVGSGKTIKRFYEESLMSQRFTTRSICHSAGKSSKGSSCRHTQPLGRNGVIDWRGFCHSNNSSQTVALRDSDVPPIKPNSNGGPNTSETVITHASSGSLISSKLNSIKSTIAHWEDLESQAQISLDKAVGRHEKLQPWVDFFRNKPEHPNSAHALTVVSESQNQIRAMESKLDEIRAKLSEMRGRLDSLLRWTGPPKKKVFCLDAKELRFVNRREAIQELLSIHSSNFVRTRKIDGFPPAIPFIDNLQGMGKSALALNYISQLPRALEKFPCPEGFRDSIMNARTLALTLRKSSLLKGMTEGEAKCEEIVIDAIIAELKAKPDEITGCPESLRKVLADSLRPSYDVIFRIIEETGEPLFLVLDEIGAAFSHEDTDTSNARMTKERLLREKSVFLAFCQQIVIPWLRIPNFHILLVGRGEFMELIGNRHALNPMSTGSLLYCRRIGLNMIRRQYIPTILKETLRIKDGQLVSLEEFYGIGSDSAPDSNQKRTKIIDALLEGTNGHPRAMVAMLDKYTSYDALVDGADRLSSELTQVQDRQQWLDSLIPHQVMLRKLLDRAVLSDVHDEGICVSVDLSASTGQEGSLKLVDLADRANIRWEGTIQDAKLYVSKAVKRHLTIFFMPFKALIAQVQLDSEVCVTYDLNFERCCWKRFQEIFGREEKDRSDQVLEHIRRWFGSSEYFDMFAHLFLGDYIGTFPKVTSVGSATFASLSQKTVSPSLWPQVRKAMFESSPRGCFYPREKSASSDAILFADQTLVNNRRRRVTIGLASKCYTGSLSTLDIRKEKKLFNAMFTSPVSGKRSTRKSLGQNPELNILVICNTGKFAEHKLAADEPSKALPAGEEYPHVDEVIFLNLSSPALRADFFGIDAAAEDSLRSSLEFLVTKGMSSGIDSLKFKREC